MDTKILKEQLHIKTILNCKYTTPVAIISQINSVRNKALGLVYCLFYAILIY